MVSFLEDFALKYVAFHDGNNMISKFSWNASHLTIRLNHCQFMPVCLCVQSESTCTLTHWGCGRMATISQTTLSHDFARMKMFVFRLRFHWKLFPRPQSSFLNGPFYFKLNWIEFGGRSITNRMMGYANMPGAPFNNMNKLKPGHGYVITCPVKWWHSLYIPKLQWLHRWSLRMDKQLLIHAWIKV